MTDLSGDGQPATDPFALEAGLAIFRSSYRGQGNFVAWLFDETGARAENGLVANEVGSFDGSQACKRREASVFRHPSTWALDHNRRTAASYQRPQTANFAYPTGKTATDFFYLSKGLKKFSFAHQGSKNVTVHISTGTVHG